AAPFILALSAKRPDNLAYKELWLSRGYNHGPLLIIEIVRVALGVFLIGVFVNIFFSTLVAILVAVPVTILTLVIFSSRIQKLYQRLEGRFMANLNERERAALENRTLS